MDPYSAAGAAAATIIGSYMQSEGQKDANETNIMLSRENREWSERMANTAHQREVKDLMAAGLNPMLSVSKGGMGAATPGVQTATVQNPNAHSAQAAQATALIAAQLGKLKAETTNIEADTTQKLTGNIPQLSASAGHLQASTENIRQEMQNFQDRWEKLKNELGITRNQYWESEGVRQEAEKRGMYPALRALVAQGQKLENEARLVGLKIPEGIAESKFWSGPDAKTGTYFRHAPKSLTSAFMGSVGAATDDVRNWSNAPSKKFQLHHKPAQGDMPWR